MNAGAQVLIEAADEGGLPLSPPGRMVCAL
jgi:hypothetical protein